MNDEEKTYVELLEEIKILRQRNAELEAQVAEYRQVEARFRLLVENSTNLISCHTPEGVYLYASPACRPLLGYDPEDLVGHLAYEFFHPDDRAVIAASHTTILEQPMVSTVSYRIRRKDGTYIWFETTSHAIRAEQTDDIVEIHTASRDITERKQMDAALRASRAILKQILDTVPQSIFWKDKDSVFLGCNQVFATAAGISAPEDIIGKTDFDLPWPRHEAEAYRADDALVIASQTPRRHIIEPLQQADGVRLWIDTTKLPLVDSHGDVYGVLGVYEDITERKRIEEALRESEARYRAVIESQIDLISRYRPDTTLTFVNDAYCQFYGKTREELIGHSYLFMIAPEFRDLVRQETENLAKNPRPIVGEYLNYRHDGKACWIQLVVHCISDEKGRVVELQAVGRDVTDRKRAEEALVESELKYRMLFKSMGQGFYLAQILYDEEGIPCDYMYIDVNSAFEHIMGLQQAHLIGKTYNELVPPDPESGWPDCFKRVAMTGIPENYTFPSKIYNSYFEVYAFKPEEGKFSALVKDITESKQVEEALRKSEERFRSLVETTSDWVWETDPNGVYTYASPKVRELLGYEPEEVIGKTPFDMMSQEEVMRIGALFQDIVANQRPIERLENMVRHKDGRRVVLETNAEPFFDADGRLLGYRGIDRDITERKQIEEALEKRVMALTQPLETAEGIAFEDLFNLSDIQHLQDLYADAFGVAALITRPDGTPITQPSNFTRLCGEIIRKTSKGVENCNYSDAMIGRYNPSGPSIRPCLSAGLCNAGASISVGGHHIANWLIGQVRNETQDEEEITKYAREIGADETAFRAAYRKVPIMSQEQFERVAQVLFVLANQLSTSAYQNVQQARFIADRKRAEEEIHKLNSELEQRVQQRTLALETVNKELESFAYVVSHDLKAPLRAISRLTTWMVTDYTQAFDDKGKEMAALLIGRVKRMDNLIEGILEYSRVGRIESEHTQIDLNRLVAEVIDSLAPSAHIQIGLARTLPTVVASKIRLTQVFQNLIGNAIKFMDKPNGEITIGCVDTGEFWTLRVADNGPGIDPKHHERIFQIFQTLRPRDEVENTGIGLSIVKKIVELYGGNIWVESEVGKGSTFYFTLPKHTILEKECIVR
jgi:PAS domain S-box-containing protein